MRKTWDRLAQAKMFGRAAGANEAAVIIDYGQKVEPTGQIESQSECFGKAGISQFGATFLMPSSAFDKTKLEAMLGEERTKIIKPGDMVVFTAVQCRCQPRLAAFTCVSTRLHCVAPRKISTYQDSASPNGWCR